MTKNIIFDLGGVILDLGFTRCDQTFEALCLKQMGKPLSHYFKKLFYSQELGLRKPAPEAFEKVLDQAGIKAEETLFIDDNADNIQGAASVGLHTYHLVSPETLLDLEF